MRLARLDAIVLRPLALRRVFSTTNFVSSTLQPVIVRAESDAGVVGYGESLPAWEVTGETTDSVVGCVALYRDPSRLAPKDVLIGKEIDTPEDVARLSQRMSPSDRPETVAGNPSAKAGIEQALLDVVARARGVSMTALLGIPPGSVPVSETVMLLPEEETLRQVGEVLGVERAVLRLKLGGAAASGPGLGVQRDIAVVRAAAQMIRDRGYRTILAADANEGFVDVETAASFCREVEGLLEWLEQPLLGSDMAGMAELRRRTSVPLMADEAVHGVPHARQLIRLGAADMLNIKLMKTGGLFPALEVAALARENGLRCQVGSMAETSLGGMAGVLAALAEPATIVSTDMASYTLFEADPFGRLQLDGTRVTFVDHAAHGTGVTEGQVASVAMASLARERETLPGAAAPAYHECRPVG
jgi:L-Ala-D/L-Glu epimerase